MDIAITDIHMRLVEAVPEFRHVLEAHLSDYEELLPHVLFGDLTRTRNVAKAGAIGLGVLGSARRPTPTPPPRAAVKTPGGR
jgi:hypothetical protein